MRQQNVSRPWKNYVLWLISEPFLESVPQIHILLVIWAIDQVGSGCSAIPNWDPLFITTFTTSVLTASFGISKFLKSGPCHIIRNDSYLMGFGTLSYILLLINIFATLVSKGLVFVFYLTGYQDDFVNRQGMAIMTPNFIPQFLHVCSLCFLFETSFLTFNSQALVTIYLALGIRKAMSTIITFPAIVLTPAFTFWSFGPVSSKTCCIYKRNEPKIHLIRMCRFHQKRFS